MGERILIAEDEATLRSNMQKFLEKHGHQVTAVGDGAEALGLLGENEFDVVLTDLRMPTADGLMILDRVRSVSPDSAVLIMTAYGSVSSAVEALRRGAHDYLLKPLSLAALATKIGRIAEHRALGRENKRLRGMLGHGTEAAELLRLDSEPMRALESMVRKVAPGHSNVLICGESGTGKEIVARAIHELSTQRDAPFVPVNVSAIPDTLVESTLFGHEKGAFTSAERRRDGLFRAASGGTLFLDEIGELPMTVQAKLLRAVEAKEVLPVGADRAVPVDARLVSASHRDLTQMASDHEFREDLLYRLSVVRLEVPPLRERLDDIPALVRRFIDRQAREQKKRVFTVSAVRSGRRSSRFAAIGIQQDDRDTTEGLLVGVEHAVTIHVRVDLAE